MVSLTSTSRYVTSGSRYQSRSSPDSTEFHGIGRGSSDCFKDVTDDFKIIVLDFADELPLWEIKCSEKFESLLALHTL